VSDPQTTGAPVTDDEEAPALCPSARAEPGAGLLGVIGEDGRVQYLKDWLEIDQAFIDEVSPHGRPEQRFRFAGRCVEGGCAQWTGHRCGVIDKVQQLTPPDGEHSVPACAIRPACRWYRQSGPEACHVCPMIITDTREDVDADAGVFKSVVERA
jgi:hypothetical protein